MAGFEVIIYGRFWVIAEDLEQHAGNPGQCWVYIPIETSPAGTTENGPGRQSWVNWIAREC